jgi:uncharacterized protein (TIGR03000 family)
MPRRLSLFTGVLLPLAFLGYTVEARAQAKAAAKPVTVRVLMPAANATLTIQGQRTRQAGLERTFESPPLEPGKRYTYTLVAFWEPNNYTQIKRTIDHAFVAGDKEVVIDLRKPNPKRNDDVLVRYVPTPDDIVEAMLKLGGVGRNDVVYDLGCGDGRMVIAAVFKAEAKRGVGVDIDPVRIRESKANAKKVGVEDKVEFRLGDVLKVKDLSEATVVLLYMGDELNMLLRPILQKQLKPGARIVSHRFTMGDWKPLKTQTITGQDGDKYQIHLWKIEEPKKDKDK